MPLAQTISTFFPWSFKRSYMACTKNDFPVPACRVRRRLWSLSTISSAFICLFVNFDLRVEGYKTSQGKLTFSETKRYRNATIERIISVYLSVTSHKPPTRLVSRWIAGANMPLTPLSHESFETGIVYHHPISVEQTAWRLLPSTRNLYRGCRSLGKLHFSKLFRQLALGFWMDLRLNHTRRSVNL